MKARGKKRIPTPTVGEILSEDFLEPLSLSAYQLAKDIGVSSSSILDLVHNRRKVSVEMALRLSRYFNMSEKFWINLQSDIDIRNARHTMGSVLKKIHPIKQPA